MLSGMARPAMALLLLGAFQVHQVHSYVAAVVEFSPDGITGPLVPSLIFSNNLRRYEEFVVDARKTYAADIIVFPEYGLTTTYTSNNRSLALEFAQIVPDKNDNIIPCTAYNDTFEYEAVRRLSCMARDNGIYLVANLIEKVDKPGAGVLLHNTNVAFDSAGTVVSRYRKFNLFGEFALNLTDISDISVFDALGARFGMITCFDLMFQQPAVELVKTYGVTDIIFPTAWIHELPFLTGVQTQAMWAHATNVNFLAAGLNHPISGKGGSGIYQGNMGRVVDSTPWDVSSFYLIGVVPPAGPKAAKLVDQHADLIRLPGDPIRTPKGPLFPPNRPQTKLIPPGAKSPYYMQENLTNYESALIEMRREIMHYSLCSNGLCCDLEVSGTLRDQTVYRFFVYNGDREFGGGYYKGFRIQTCALVRCKFSEDPVKNCGLVLSQDALKVEFTHIRITGNFSKDALMGPNIVDGEFKILAGNQYIFRKEPDQGQVSRIDFQLAERIDQNILTFGVWGRVFPPWDSGFTENLRPPSWILPTAIVVGGAFIVVCFLVTIIKFTPDKYK
ncbi:vanin-like protein 1 isoform X2 [Neocloeon triangulifer]|nr:vanin-like protein 1 isoform X2 [Neocloeon triangulifer]